MLERPFYEPEVETMSREEIQRLQEARILQLVPYVYSRAPLTRHIWDEAGVHPRDIKSLADFKEKAPFIKKDTIRAFRDGNDDPFGGLLCTQPPHLKGIGFTSGTTGDPTPIPRSRVTLSFQDLKRSFWHIGLRPKDYYIYALFTFREGHGVDRAHDAGFRPITFAHSPLEVGRMIEASIKYRPGVFFMLSTPLVGAIDKFLRANPQLDPQDIFSSYKGAVFGGETLGAAMRQRVEGWGLPVFEYSSLGDVCGAMECSAHDGMHTWEDFVLVENLDPEGTEPVGDNEVGELVVTSLLDDVAPLVRFRTDDLVRYTAQPCSCGRTHGRMWPQGRTGDQVLVQGRSILPKDIIPLLQSLPETSTGLFQIIRRQRESDVLELRVAYDTSATADAAKLEAFLYGYLQDALAVPVKIQMVTEEELLKLGPPQKIPRVSKS